MSPTVGLLLAIGAIWLALYVLITLHVLPMALLGRWFGLTVSQIKIGLGPALLSARLADAPLMFAALPASGHTQFDEDPARLQLNGLAWPKFAAVCLIGCLTLLAAGFVCLGTGVVSLVKTTLQALPPLLLTPFDAVPRMAQTLFKALAEQSVVQSFGAAAVVMAVLNLLPIPPLNGAAILIEPLRRLGVPSKLLTGLQLLGTAVLLYFTVLVASIAVSMARMQA
jgi:membrane-associated protease RseP (regulator of RpoE activity)